MNTFKALFADIDGCFNSEQFVRMKNRTTEFDYQALCPQALANLEYVFEEVENLKIVISSTWRKGKSLEVLRSYFPESLRDRIIDTTPIFPGEPRGNEIQDWLTRHPEVTSFAIIEDDSDMEHLMPHLAHCSSRLGFMLDVAHRAVHILNVGPLVLPSYSQIAEPLLRAFEKEQKYDTQYPNADAEYRAVRYFEMGIRKWYGLLKIMGDGLPKDFSGEEMIEAINSHTLQFFRMFHGELRKKK